MIKIIKEDTKLKTEKSFDDYNGRGSQQYIFYLEDLEDEVWQELGIIDVKYSHSGASTEIWIFDDGSEVELKSISEEHREFDNEYMQIEETSKTEEEYKDRIKNCLMKYVVSKK